MFRQADEIIELTDRRKKKAQWTVGKYLGAILYDILMNLNDIQQIQRKWATYLGKIRNDVKDADEAIVVSGAQNISVDKLKRISVKVDVYLLENRIMTKEELGKIHHPVPAESDTEDSNDEEDENNDDDVSV